jgi:hypothetical protein
MGELAGIAVLAEAVGIAVSQAEVSTLVGPRVVERVVAQRVLPDPPKMKRPFFLEDSVCGSLSLVFLAVSFFSFGSGLVRLPGVEGTVSKYKQQVFGWWV